MKYQQIRFDRGKNAGKLYEVRMKKFFSFFLCDQLIDENRDREIRWWVAKADLLISTAIDTTFVQISMFANIKRKFE